MFKLIHQRGLRTRISACFSFTVLFLGLVCAFAFAEDKSHYSVDEAFDIIERFKQKLLEGKNLSKEELKALELLEDTQQKANLMEEKSDLITYQEKDNYEKQRYRTLEGTESAMGSVVEDDIICEEKLRDNMDGLTFTYLRRTREGYAEKWVFLKNASPFYWANYWSDIDKKLNELDKVEDNIKYQLPPSKVLIEIIKLSKICPFEFSSITGTDIKIFNTEKIVPYWANEEYFYTDSETTRYAAVVSLYYAKKGRLNKNNFAMIWPCYLKSREMD